MSGAAPKDSAHSQFLREPVRKGFSMPEETKIKMEAKGLNFYYGPTLALKNINIAIKDRQTTALIGPSGCGKSTFLRTLNRMNDLIPHTRVDGTVSLDG